MDQPFIFESTCPQCGRKFIPAVYHAYRTSPKGARVCSYTCMLRYREVREARKVYKSKLRKGGFDEQKS